MSRNSPSGSDAESEARFRAFLESVPAYLLDPPDIRWITWICGSSDEEAVLLHLYRRFGVDERGDRLSNEPEPKKELTRRWCEISVEDIADRMRLSVPKVKKAIVKLEEKGLIECVQSSQVKKNDRRIMFNWDQVLQATISAVESEDPFKKMLDKACIEGKAARNEKRKKK